MFDTLEDFEKLKGLLEECIDIGKARQNDYVINADFDKDLKSFRVKIDQVETDIEQLRKAVEDDLGISKRINLVESQQYTYLFEVNKKEGDAGMRKSKLTYKTITVKKGVTCFTCQDLKELVSRYVELEEAYREKQEDMVIKVLEIVSTYHPVLEKVSSIVA